MYYTYPKFLVFLEYKIPNFKAVSFFILSLMTYLLCLKTLFIPIFLMEKFLFHFLMDYPNITMILLAVSYNYNINILNISSLTLSYLSLSSI